MRIERFFTYYALRTTFYESLWRKTNDTNYFLDTSALVKRYVYETGSDWIQLITTPQESNTLIIARITWVEMLSALARLQREGNISQKNVEAFIKTLQYAFDMQYQIVEFDASLAEEAGRLVQQYPLRAYDSVQLASAIKIQTALAGFQNVSYTFVSADNRLLNVAKITGLSVINPNDFP